MLTKSIPILIVAMAFLGFSGTSIGSTTVDVENTIQDESGRSITITMSVRKNNDGTYTITSIEPEQDAKVFFDRACQEEFGSSTQWADIGQEDVRISSPENYTYSCKTRHGQ